MLTHKINLLTKFITWGTRRGQKGPAPQLVQLTVTFFHDRSVRCPVFYFHWVKSQRRVSASASALSRAAHSPN